MVPSFFVVYADLYANDRIRPAGKQYAALNSKWSAKLDTLSILQLTTSVPRTFDNINLQFSPPIDSLNKVVNEIIQRVRLSECGSLSEW